MKDVFYSEGVITSFYDVRGYKIKSLPTIHVKCSTDPMTHRTTYSTFVNDQIIYSGGKAKACKVAREEIDKVVNSNTNYNFIRRY